MNQKQNVREENYIKSFPKSVTFYTLMSILGMIFPFLLRQQSVNSKIDDWRAQGSGMWSIFGLVLVLLQ